MNDSELRQIGFFSYSIAYKLNPGGYGMAMMKYGGDRKDRPTVVDVTSFGSHTCLWLKGREKSALDVQLFTNSSAASKWTVLIYTEDWQHYCLALTDLVSVKENPVDLTMLKHVYVTDLSSPEVPVAFLQRRFNLVCA